MSKQDRIAKRKSALANKLSRKDETIQTLKSFLIVTEGTKTEVNYFKSFPLYEEPEIRTVVLGTGTNTLSLVAEAKKIVSRYAEDEKNFDEIWVVFDKDSFPNDNFDNAIQSAQASGFRVAFSNECFELWYVLHYRDMQAPLLRTDYFQMLSEYLGHDYEKNSSNMYEILLPYQDSAIKRAEKLKEACRETPLNHDKNPLTLVVDLVTELNKSTKNRYHM